MKRTRWLAPALVLMLALTACSGGDGAGSEGGTEPDGGTTTGSETAGGSESEAAGGGSDTAERVRAAIVGDESTLTPYTYVTGFPGWNLLMLQYDSLMQIDAAGVPQPWLADSVQTSQDGLSYVVTIVDGVTWHDGEALDADDVAFTINYFIDNTQSRFSRDLAGVTGAEVTGDAEVTISLDAPKPSFPLSALADVPIIPEHIWSEVDNPEEHQFEGPNVGSGPYILTDYTPDQSYRLEANPDYFLGAPAVDELILVQFADDTGALAAMRSGEVDVAFRRVSPEQIEILDGQDAIDISQGPEFTTQLVYFDTTKAPFDDVAVRQAISLAMDRQDLVDTVYLGAATIGSAGWIHPDQPVYNSDVATETDVAGAETLLDDAGYTDSDGDGVREFDGQPMSFDFITPSGDSLRLRLAELVSEMLGDIGIEANVSSVEQSTWEDAVWPGFDVNNGRSYEMSMWGWSAPVQADVSRIASLVHSDPAIGALNLTGFSDPEMDEIAEALQTEIDEAARTGLSGDLQSLFAERLPFVTLLYPDGAYAYNSDVYGNWAFIAGQGIVNKLSLLPEDARP